MELNRRDLVRHEQLDCERRKVQCHNCAELKQEMERAIRQFIQMNGKMNEIEAKQTEVIADVNEKLHKLELSAQQQEVDNKDIMQKLGVVIEQMERLSS